ncbi:LysR family transcriptional regulator [Methylobacterium terricola]|uniref:LysR family transcriptional regulator n=2 Tax=Methylobacterium terricola TaxID=2583531 RepID=A0A5C4LII2_9HYPH|nr:LysR family transcriptional regulator [Methylobacterium terricola]
METLHMMRLFMRVADSDSLSAAARSCGLSPASVSRQINALEQELGVRLINRTSRRLALTEIGQLYRERGSAILSQLDELTDRVSQHQASPHGVIHVHSRVSVAEHFVIPVLPSFLSAYPDVRVNLWLTEESRDLVENNIDVAIRLGNLDEPQLAVRKIASGAPRILFASPAYLSARPPIRCPEDLRSHNCLSWPLDGRFEDGHAIWRFKDNDQTQEVRVRGTVQINNTNLLVHLALAGLGIVLLPIWTVAGHLSADRLQRILPDIDVTPTIFDHQIYAVFQRSSYTPRKIRAFIDHLVRANRSAMPAHCDWDQDTVLNDFK